MTSESLTIISVAISTLAIIVTLLTLFGKSQKHSQNVDDRLSSIEEKVGIAYDKSLKNENDIIRLEAKIEPFKSYRTQRHTGGGGKV